MQAARLENDGWRIPARELEKTVLNALIQFLSNDRQLIDLIARSDLNPHLAQSVSNKAMEIRGVLQSTNTTAKRELVHAIVRTRYRCRPANCVSKSTLPNWWFCSLTLQFPPQIRL